MSNLFKDKREAELTDTGCLLFHSNKDEKCFDNQNRYRNLEIDK